MKTAEEQKGPRAARAGLAFWGNRRYASLTSKVFLGPLSSAAEGIPALKYSPMKSINWQLQVEKKKKNFKFIPSSNID